MPRRPLSPFLLAFGGEAESRPATPARRTLDLEAGPLLIVGAMRAWQARMLRGDLRAPDWRDIFAIADLPEALAEDFGRLMALLALGARRPVVARCCACGLLGADEAALIETLAAVQRGDPPGATGHLGAWLTPAALPPALALARRIAEGIDRPDLRLGPPRSLH